MLRTSLALAALLLASAAAPAAQALDEPAMESVIDAFANEAAPLMLDAALTDFAAYRGDVLGVAGGRTNWDSEFRPTTAVGPLNGTIIEAPATSADGHPNVVYELEVVDPDGRQFPHDIFFDGALDTAELLDARLGGIGWERQGDVSDQLDTPQSISWSECPGGAGGRFLAYIYTPLPEGNAEVQLYVGRSLGPSCTEAPHRFAAPVPVPVDCAGLARLVEAGTASARFDAVRTDRPRPATGFYDRFALSDSLTSSSGAYGEQRFDPADPTRGRHTRLYVTLPAPMEIGNALHEARAAAGLADTAAACLGDGWERSPDGARTRFSRDGAPTVWTGLLPGDDDRLVPTILLEGRAE